jgi:hypothetical protein
VALGSFSGRLDRQFEFIAAATVTVFAGIDDDGFAIVGKDAASPKSKRLNSLPYLELDAGFHDRPRVRFTFNRWQFHSYRESTRSVQSRRQADGLLKTRSGPIEEKETIVRNGCKAELPGQFPRLPHLDLKAA